MPKIGIEVPGEPLADLDRHAGGDSTVVDRGEAVRASTPGTLDTPDDRDARHGRLDDERVTDQDGTETGETDGD